MGIWYRAGTVAVASGSKTVTGTNTQWQNLIFGVAPGATFYGPDGKPYEIDTVDSNTSLTLVTNYSGTTASAQAYAVDPTRTGSVASLAAQTSEVLKFSQKQFTQIQTWFTGAANANVTLESPAGQTITVPSYGKVTSEGEGQAARAKIEADKATAAAALSVNAVREASVPFPDVWAPLNDSLRMFAGYGREVKVGDDVVGRYVNFSRATTATYIDKSGELKTAAINEPRFEKEGLLIEGPSTNLVPRSEFTVIDGSYIRSNFLSCLSLVNGALVFTVDAAASNGFWVEVNTSTPQPVGKYTGSLILDSAPASFSGSASMFFRDPVGLSDIQAVGGSVALSPVATPVGAKLAATGDTPDTAQRRVGIRLTFSGTYAVGDKFAIRAPQIENLPFASSYIPTSGAAATRTGDVAYIPWNGNVDPLLGVGNKATAAVEYSLKGSGSAHAHRILLSHFGGLASEGNFILRLDAAAPHMSFYRGASTTSKADVSASDRSGVAVVRVKADNTTNLFVNGQVFGGGIAPAIKPGSPQSLGIGGAAGGSFPLFGHIRNLKLWNRDLTNPQVMSLK